MTNGALVRGVAEHEQRFSGFEPRKTLCSSLDRARAGFSSTQLRQAWILQLHRPRRLGLSRSERFVSDLEVCRECTVESLQDKTRTKNIALASGGARRQGMCKITDQPTDGIDRERRAATCEQRRRACPEPSQGQKSATRVVGCRISIGCIRSSFQEVSTGVGPSRSQSPSLSPFARVHRLLLYCTYCAHFPGSWSICSSSWFSSMEVY
jgi:hypothetical protein